MADGLGSLELKNAISREEFNNWIPIATSSPTRQSKTLDFFKTNINVAFLLSEITIKIYGENTQTNRSNCSQILYKLKKAGYVENKQPYWIFAKQEVSE